MRAAAVRMCFPSPSGFGGIGETGKVTGVAAADDREVFDMVRWAISLGMNLTGAIRLRLWRINGECAESRVLRMRMCQKMGDKVRKSVLLRVGQRTRTFYLNYVHPRMLFISASCLKDLSISMMKPMLHPRWPWS